MAKKSASEKKADRDFYYRLALTGVGIYATYRIVNYLNPFALFEGKPGPTDRVKFDYPRTQQSAQWVGVSDTYPDGYYYQKSPWNPKEIANRLFTHMNGATHPLDIQREEAFKDLGNLGIERTKWLHNYWLDEMDPEETLYRWVNGEVSLTTNIYDAIAMLERAGVAW